MIGDIVRVVKHLFLKKGTVVRIRGIDSDNSVREKGLVGSVTCTAVDDEDRRVCGIWTKWLEPIPLTPEILEKNGFTMQRDTVSKRFVWFDDTGRNGTTVSIFLYDPPICGVKVLVKIETDCSHKTGVDSIHNCDIEFVHQLQHALRLCGIEKEITV